MMWIFLKNIISTPLFIHEYLLFIQDYYNLFFNILFSWIFIILSEYHRISISVCLVQSAMSFPCHERKQHLQQSELSTRSRIQPACRLSRDPGLLDRPHRNHSRLHSRQRTGRTNARMLSWVKFSFHVWCFFVFFHWIDVMLFFPLLSSNWSSPEQAFTWLFSLTNPVLYALICQLIRYLFTRWLLT